MSVKFLTVEVSAVEKHSKQLVIHLSEHSGTRCGAAV